MQGLFFLQLLVYYLLRQRQEKKSEGERAIERHAKRINVAQLTAEEAAREFPATAFPDRSSLFFLGDLKKEKSKGQKLLPLSFSVLLPSDHQL